MGELSKEDINFINDTLRKRESESVFVSGNDSYKLDINSELNWHKSTAIPRLKLCTSGTPRNEIAELLKETFKYWPSDKDSHWIWIAQTYTVRTLNWVMSATIKKYLVNGIRKTPPAYFIFLLKFRKKKKGV